jgi:hypothetical protein
MMWKCMHYYATYTPLDTVKYNLDHKMVYLHFTWSRENVIP